MVAHHEHDCWSVSEINWKGDGQKHAKSFSSTLYSRLHDERYVVMADLLCDPFAVVVRLVLFVVSYSINATVIMLIKSLLRRCLEDESIRIKI